MRGNALALALCLTSCGSPPTPDAASAPTSAAHTATPPTGASPAVVAAEEVMPRDVAGLPPRAVCIEGTDRTLTPAIVRASIGGVYDDAHAIRLADLNWMAPTVGCVTYPGSVSRRARCGDATVDSPVVQHTLCGQ